MTTMMMVMIMIMMSIMIIIIKTIIIIIMTMMMMMTMMMVMIMTMVMIMIMIMMTIIIIIMTMMVMIMTMMTMMMNWHDKHKFANHITRDVVVNRVWLGILYFQNNIMFFYSLLVKAISCKCNPIYTHKESSPSLSWIYTELNQYWTAFCAGFYTEFHSNRKIKVGS